MEPSSTAWLCPGSTPLHIAAALNHRDVCQTILRWQRRSGRDNLGNVRNEMGLKPSQCAMLAGHYTLASQLLEMQTAMPSHASEQRRRRRRGSTRRRADGPPPHAGGAPGGELTREMMLSMMQRAKLLVQLQTLADDERRGMAALRHKLGDEEGDVDPPAPRGGSNPELVLLRNTINALQEALQMGALPTAEGGAAEAVGATPAVAATSEAVPDSAAPSLTRALTGNVQLLCAARVGHHVPSRRRLTGVSQAREATGCGAPHPSAAVGRPLSRATCGHVPPAHCSKALPST